MFGKNDHPFLLFFYYVNLLMFCMFSIHPAVLISAAIGGILWLSLLLDRNMLRKTLFFYFFMVALITVTNPLFSHRGQTILFFLNGNAVTKEALAYGLFLGLKMMAIFAYSRCFSEVFKISQFLYLFGKISPKLALLLSMAVSFLPRLKRQAKEVSNLQRTMGMYGMASVADRVLSGIRVFDSMVTWSLEQGIVTADSMNARGYGEGKRTSFGVYRFKKRDGRYLIMLCLLFTAAYMAWAGGIYEYSFYPKMEVIKLDGLYIAGYGAQAVILLLPVCLEIKEKIKWNVLESRI